MSEKMTVRAAASGPATWSMGGLFERLVSGADTGGLLDASLVTQPPGIAPPMHVHTREAEAWYLLEGTLTYQAGDERVDLEPGGFIYLPQGLPHAFRTTGTGPVRYLALTLPGNVMGLYDEVGTPAAERRLPDGGVTGEDIARWMAAAPRYGLQVVGPPLPL
jgi:mannose-6-phosphate isomerase-like protein (cupin superfamily)